MNTGNRSRSSLDVLLSVRALTKHFGSEDARGLTAGMESFARSIR